MKSPYLAQKNKTTERFSKDLHSRDVLSLSKYKFLKGSLKFFIRGMFYLCPYYINLFLFVHSEAINSVRGSAT